MPTRIGVIVSSGKATLAELDSVYSLEDAYLLLDVILVDAHNQRMADKHHRQKGN